MIQKICAALGESGCYFLSILHIAEGLIGATIDPARAYEDAVDAKFMQRNCFVDYPERVMEANACGDWEMVKAPADYETAPDEYEILRFERSPKPGVLYGHFVVGDHSGGVAWDPFGDSITARQGTLISKRIFRRKP